MTAENDEADLVRRIAAMPQQSVAEFVADQSRRKTLSKTVRTLNEAVLSADLARRTAARTAIEKLGFL